MPRVEFEEARHIYWVDGKLAPSVSAIIRPITKGLEGIPEAVLKRKAELGSEIHAACELMDLGDTRVYDTLHPDLLPYLQAYERFLEVCKPVWWMIEEPLGCDDPLFAGTPDRIGVVQNGLEPGILDVKTSEPHAWQALQTAGYSHLAAANFILPEGCPRWGLHLRKDGTYRLKVHQGGHTEWQAALIAHHLGGVQ